ncbi:hypothetical protein [Pontimicrobium sp. MEBiC06410]
MKQTRDILKTYFETGDYPTEAQFAELIDSYAHLNEFNFGINIKPSADYKGSFYHFYKANSGTHSEAAHKIIEAQAGSTAAVINGYNNVLSRSVLHKTLEVSLVGTIDIEKHKPKIIVERYKQRKKLSSGYKKPAGYYKEKPEDAALWNRKSEYDVTSNTMELDLKPIHYFRPHSNLYKDFVPSGSVYRRNSYKYSRHAKPFVPIRLKLQITIDTINYESKPVDVKIALGSSGINDAINYLI